jgi:transposase InsO family protein
MRSLKIRIHHSDRGSQYAADAFQQCLSAWGVIPSMSRKANPMIMPWLKASSPR